MNMKNMLLATLASTALMMPAISHAEQTKRTSTVKTTAIGAAAGAVVGGMVGKNKKGALIGAAAGGLAGAAYSYHRNRKADVTDYSDNDYYNGRDRNSRYEDDEDGDRRGSRNERERRYEDDDDDDDSRSNRRRDRRDDDD